MKLIGTNEILQEIGPVNHSYLEARLLQARDGKFGHISLELPAHGKMYRFTSKVLGSSVVYVERVKEEHQDANIQS